MTFRLADLDADEVYWGMVDRDAAVAGDVVFRSEEIPEGDRVPGVVYLPGECDLAPGRYRWNADSVSFDPLSNFMQRHERGAPIPERALYELVRALQAGGASVPEYTASWADWYQQSIG
jgi:hypothetical protein